MKSELKIAIAKGKSFEEELALLEKCGYKIEFRERELSSKLNDIVVWFVKPKDVPVWVESGVADLGIVGEDIIREKEYDVLELIDLKIGRCRFSFAAPENSEIPKSKVIIATKFPNLTRKHAERFFPEYEIVELQGSVEIAPLVGLSHIIADLVSTGRTLKENKLVEIKVLEEFSTYLIANRESFNTKYRQIKEFLQKISKAIGEELTFL